MKKYLYLMLLICLLLLSACSNGKTQSLEWFYNDAKIENVDKVIIQDSTTGYSKTITNQEQIGEFLSLINEIEFTPQENQVNREGWRYGITLFDKEFKFNLNEIDITYYDTNPDINTIVDKYYKQLEIVKE
ncbi:hypothetical protein B857_03826 [Solibacillus isronensis B3W22]|uniref:Lipoprotein n=1 Tax=Solibacillus isronensis B3W22 TaxID=1224748 RepID=K1KLN7_9BACL|nr:hypothetical protein [Solibacillus isronensis]AMO85349.1 hypothetical protein SOLI23_07045 [Solibacillus silvestris]EKB43366.1 hypothetical protein B857_03826 [Solibacillus isronensis B3W22]